MHKQKYKRGNVVKIKVGEHGGEKAIIEYSYGEKFASSYYGSHESVSYSIVLLRDGNSVAWFEEEDLSFIEEGGEHLFRIAQEKADRLTKKRTNLKWIAKNWEKIRKNGPPSDTILFLFDKINFKSSYLRNGEFALLGSDWYEWLPLFNCVMGAKDENELTTILKISEEGLKQRVFALFREIRAVVPHHKGGCHGQEEVERDFLGAYPRASCRGKRPVG